MKKILLMLLTVIVLFSGCSSNSPTKDETTSSTTSTESSKGNDISKPKKDKELSEKLSKNMLDSFGGMGDPKYADFATSWYHFIDDFEVYKDGENYFATITLNEDIADSTLRLFLSTNYTQDGVDLLAPAILDAATALELDETDMLIIADDLTKILDDKSDLGIIYSSLEALKIPALKYLANDIGISESDARANVNDLGGSKAVGAIVAHMAQDFGGSFSGLTQDVVKIISLAALTNFKDVYLEKIIVKTPSSDKADEYKNTLSKPNN